MKTPEEIAKGIVPYSLGPLLKAITTAIQSERDRAAKREACLVEALERWLSWYGDDQGRTIMPDKHPTIADEDRDQGAKDVIFGRNVLATHKEQEK